MLKKLFGPFPDEPLLYGFDKIIGHFNKFDSKFKSHNKTDPVVPINDNNDFINNEKTTKNDTGIQTVSWGM